MQTENIFPVIKKFLYSDHEIFLREIVSNAIDATQKLNALASLGQFKDELGDLTIVVKLDDKKKTLTVSDRGIGMTKEEIEKYINQIAFSGAKDFLDKYKDTKEQLIGHFGLGFYSAFMVSDQVEIVTKSYTDAPAQHWTCDGSPSYTLEEGKERTDRGTDIILHISDDCKEFLEERRILELLNKYCRFMPIAIRFGEESEWVDSETEKDKDGKPTRVEVKKPRIVNITEPAWKKKPADLKDEDYKKFYHELYPMNFENPLFQIHLNVDYPFNLTGILYFPKIRKTIDPNRNKIQLYCNQVFVTDNVEGVVPEYLMLLHGVLDSPDIPLNVSRSYLQADSNVKKISSHISKKVADKLEEMFKNDRKDFENKWDDIKIFIEYGMLTDEKFAERAMKFYLLKSTTPLKTTAVDDKDNNAKPSQYTYYSLDDYRDKIKALQTDKHKDIIYLYATDVEEQHSYIAAAKEKGYDVLLMDSVLNAHFINMLEQKTEHTRFVRVDGDVVEKLVQHDDAIPEKLTKEEQDKLKPIIENEIDKQKYTVLMESLESNEAPMMITQNEFMRRYKEMSLTGGGANLYGDLPESYNLVVNINSPLISQVLSEPDAEKQKNLVHQLTDLALLSNGLLKGEALTTFVKRSMGFIGK